MLYVSLSMYCVVVLYDDDVLLCRIVCVCLINVYVLCGSYCAYCISVVL